MQPSERAAVPTPPPVVGDRRVRLEPLPPDGSAATPPPNLTRVLAHHPQLQDAWKSFASYILFEQTLPRRDREIAMLRIGWHRRCEYEWKQHVRLARRAGLSDEEITAIGDGGGDWAPNERAVLAAVDELVGTSTISEPTWEALTGHYTVQNVLDLVFTVGQYNLVSWFLNSFGVPLDDGI